MRFAWLSARPLVAALALALVVLAGGATAAEADVFGAISLASAGTFAGTSQVEQATQAGDSAISGNGRYVVFDGSFGGRTGVFRRDLTDGEVAIVAEGDAVDPSIDGDGRYVSFTTTRRLDEENDTNAAPDVYVRDMDKPDSSPCPSDWEASGEGREACAYTLVSAVDDGSQGLSYAYRGSDPSFEETHYGSVASRRSAISEDGSTVVFVTTAESDLANPGRGAPTGAVEPAETPMLEVAVRHLETRQTELVSVLREPLSGGTATDASGQPEPVPTQTEGGSISYGAAYVGGTRDDVAFPRGYPGASISADGSTVVWMGQDISDQAPTLTLSDNAQTPQYTEPLWRRIDEGQDTPTRRVTGGSDPSSPFCQASGETQLSTPSTLSDPCQGPFDTSGGAGGVPGLWTLGSEADYVPQLSGNGMTVAFLATAREVASGEELKVGEASDDLYVVNMSSGLTRVEASRRLTELAGGSTSDPARTAPILDLTVSPDGSEVAFTTERTVFPLGSPSYVSAPAASVGMAEVYDIDFADDTLTRVTQGYEGEASEAPSGVKGVASSPSFSADGNLLAFSSEADNLVYGDGNKADDAFVVPRIRFVSTPTPQEFSGTTPPIGLAPAWQLGLTAYSRRDGSVVVDANVPGPGSLRAGARGTVRVQVHVSAKRSDRRGARRTSTRTTVATRTIATRSTRSRGEGVVALALTLAKSYAALANSRGGFSANVEVTFAASGHKTLRQSIPVTFVRTELKRTSRKKPRSSKHGSAGKRGKGR
jgi:Tol biopolymer transport system component